MYLQDSFFDLSPWGRVGLIVISTCLFLFTAFITRVFLDKKSVWLSLLGSLGIFVLFVCLSPQIYYMYYRILIDGLPLQWVIKPLEAPLAALKYITFQGPKNLSAHSQGLLGWFLIVAPFLRINKTSGQARNR